MTDQAPMTDELLSEIRGAVARGWCTPENRHKEMDADLAFAIADEVHALYGARLRAGGEAVHFRYEMERMRSVNDHLSRVLTGIHALLYPPTHVVDGATMVFRPNGLDAHGLMQSLSDRIRAIPGELAAYAAPPRAPVAEGAAPTLWCLHILGPDDVHPAPSKAHAERAAIRFNEWFANRPSKHEHDPRMEAVVEPWPHSPESHAEDVEKFCAEWLTPRAAEVPAVDEAFRVLVEAVEREFCSDATERGETMNGDNEKVSFPENRCRITFGMIRNARAALSRPAAEVVPEGLCAPVDDARFGHHPDPSTDFCIEVESLIAREFNARHRIAELGKEPEGMESVKRSVNRAMDFRVGGDPVAVSAKETLRALATSIIAAEVKP